MENFTQVNSASFNYRLVIREILGVTFYIFLVVVLLLIYFLTHLALQLTLDIFLGLTALFGIQFFVVFVICKLEYSNLKYLLENNSISLRQGVIYSETETIPFDKIKNSTFDQSLVQRMFAVGNIVIDQDDEKYIWTGIDNTTASKIMEAVSAKSNIQPITISTVPNSPQPTQT